MTDTELSKTTALVTRLSIDDLKVLYKYVSSRLKVELLLTKDQLNLVDEIAADCGWHPLVNSETMTVHLGGKEYVIRRSK